MSVVLSIGSVCNWTPQLSPGKGSSLFKVIQQGWAEASPWIEVPFAWKVCPPGQFGLGTQTGESVGEKLELSYKSLEEGGGSFRLQHQGCGWCQFQTLEGPDPQGDCSIFSLKSINKWSLVEPATPGCLLPRRGRGSFIKRYPRDIMWCLMNYQLLSVQPCCSHHDNPHHSVHIRNIVVTPIILYKELVKLLETVYLIQ